MKPSDTLRPATEAVSQAARFLVEVRRRPELMRRLQQETLDLDELVALGGQLGFRFDGPALQQAFRNDFMLRLAIRQRADAPSTELDG